MNLVPLNINSISIKESRLNMGEGNKGHAWALLPLVLFIALFLGIGIATGDFSNMPLNVAITITVIVALMMNRKEKFSKRLKYLLKGRAFKYCPNGFHLYLSRCIFNYC